jgi:hypothetical protein
LACPKDLSLITKYRHRPELATKQKERMIMVVLAVGFVGGLFSRKVGDGTWPGKLMRC